MDLNRIKLCDGVHFSSVNVSKFKTIRLSVTFVIPLNKETAAANALLPMVLTHSCRLYPDFTHLNRHLDSLYGANISSHARKLGDNVVITMAASGIDEKYALNGEKIASELATLLSNMIFDPKLENGVFCDEDITPEKNQLLDLVDAELNDKRAYSISKMLEKMYRDDVFGTKYFGSREQVEKLTAQDLFSAWKNILSTARTEIIFVGSCDCSGVADVFKSSFEKIERNIVTAQTKVIDTVDEVTEFSEKMDISQSKLVMGFRTSSCEPSTNAEACRLMTAILGGCTTSKFFVNIREKLSLCYYCAARYDRFKGLVIVDSGVQETNLIKTKDEVLNQLHLLQNGELSDHEFDSAKLALSEAFKSAVDTTSDIESWYLTHILLDKIISPTEMAERLNSITKEDVINEAKKLHLDTVFSLIGN